MRRTGADGTRMRPLRGQSVATRIGDRASARSREGSRVGSLLGNRPGDLSPMPRRGSALPSLFGLPRDRRHAMSPVPGCRGACLRTMRRQGVDGVRAYPGMPLLRGAGHPGSGLFAVPGRRDDSLRRVRREGIHGNVGARPPGASRGNRNRRRGRVFQGRRRKSRRNGDKVRFAAGFLSRRTERGRFETRGLKNTVRRDAASFPGRPIV
jgi:hypothetical protein